VKLGILDFSYANTKKSVQKLRDDAFYTINLGDNAQSIAARDLLSRVGYDASNIVTVDRDMLASYSGEPVALIMNGVFFERNFPVPDAVIPIFVGFCTKSERLIRDHSEWFKRFQPVGCRDVETARMLTAAGIQATVTGCVTMTFPRRTRAPDKSRMFIVYGSGAGKLPSAVLKHIPHDLLDDAEFIYHRLPVNEMPLTEASRRWIEHYEEGLLGRYRKEASLVLTPLLHVATPCLAMGVPLVLCRTNWDTRFGFVEKFTRIYTPDDVSEVVWRCEAPDIRGEAELFVEDLRLKITKATA